jgi:hypothetical protein
MALVSRAAASRSKLFRTLAVCGKTGSLTVAALQRPESTEPRTLVSGASDFWHRLLRCGLGYNVFDKKQGFLI